MPAVSKNPALAATRIWLNAWETMAWSAMTISLRLSGFALDWARAEPRMLIEASRMIAEKPTAVMDAMLAATEAGLKPFHVKTRANARRLSGGAVRRRG